MRAPSRTLIAAALASIALASPARANGRFPATNQLVLAPTDPSKMLLRTTFGVLVSRDAGKTWDWICEKAIGYGGQTEDPSFGITASTSIVGGTFEGLVVSAAPDVGCNWTFVGGDLAGKVVVDVVVRPDAPHTALALTNKYTMVNDAGDPLYASQVFASTDDGAHWAALGTPIDPTAVLETIEVAASDPHRLYVSGFSGTGANLKGVLYVSTDDGTTWAPEVVPLDTSTENAPYIAAVDPTNADRVYVRTNGKNASRLLVTSDAGKSFTSVFTGAQLAGFALSPDGSKVYVGGPKDGLNVASTSDFKFARVSTIAVQCLRATGATLYACSNEVSGFVLGASTDDGKSFSPILHLTSIRGPLACSASSPTSACAADWPALEDTLGFPPPDAGSDAGSGGGGSTKSCSCGVSGNDAGALSAIAAAVAAIAAAIRRRRR